MIAKTFAGSIGVTVVALAAAFLYGGTPALVLADPTTAVDSVTEQAVAKGVVKHRAGRTTIVLTSAPAWAAEMEVA